MILISASISHDPLPSLCVMSPNSSHQSLNIGTILIKYISILTWFHLQRPYFQIRSHLQVLRWKEKILFLLQLSILHFWHQTWVFFSHTEQFCDTSWVSYNLTQCWYCLLEVVLDPTGWEFSSLRLFPLQMPVMSLGCHLCFWLASYKWRFPQLPPWAQ